MIITDKAQIKIAELRESNNLRLSGSDELECYELIESDLKLPADATFTRSSVAYLSDGTQVAANVPRFEQGKFGKAIMIEEGTIDGTRSPEILTIPGEVMPDNEGTITLWAKKNNTKVYYRKIIDAESPRIDWQWNNSGRYYANFGGANLSVADPAQDTEWHFYAITYSGRTVNMYFDGVKVASGKATVDLVSFSDLTLGSRFNGVNQADALIDDLRISNRARTDEEILAAYQSGQPLPVDEWTTYKLDFDDKVRITTQGQIICNELIEI